MHEYSVYQLPSGEWIRISHDPDTIYTCFRKTLVSADEVVFPLAPCSRSAPLVSRVGGPGLERQR
ncbi:MAG TPA: hypothetical protein VH593_01880, partial [Ktedonobacteraceae bacterium]